MSLLTRASLFMNSSGLIQPQNSLGKKKTSVYGRVCLSLYHHSIQSVLNMAYACLSISYECVCVWVVCGRQ